MLYEIINPSDKYTIEAPSLDIAAVACMLLGSGQYAFDPIDGDESQKVPLFLLGGHKPWCQEKFGLSTGDLIKSIMENHEKRTALAECFESCLIGGAANRDTYYAGLSLIDDPAKKEIWRYRWHDKRRSSMNDIGGRAYAMAKKLRDGSASPLKGNEAPQQILRGW